MTTINPKDLTDAPKIYTNAAFENSASVRRLAEAELNSLKGKKTQKADRRRAELNERIAAADAYMTSNPQRFSSAFLTARIISSLAEIYGDAGARCNKIIGDMRINMLHTLEWSFDDLVLDQTTMLFIKWIWAGINKQTKTSEGQPAQPLTLAVLMQAIGWARDMARREAMNIATNTNFSTNPTANLIERYKSAQFLKILESDYGPRFCYAIETAERAIAEGNIEDDTDHFPVALPELA